MVGNSFADGREREGDRDSHDMLLPDDLLEGWLLILIAREPRHGYEIARELETLPCSLPHQTTIYRQLASLEEQGFLDSRWHMRSSAPPIRIYSLTERGYTRLRHMYSRILQLQRLCHAFLDEAPDHL